MTVILFQEREKERAENEDADDDDDDEDEEDQTEDDDEEVEEEDNEKGYSLRRNRAEPSRYGTLAKQPRVTVVKRNRPAVALFSRSGQFYLLQWGARYFAAFRGLKYCTSHKFCGVK